MEEPKRLWNKRFVLLLTIESMLQLSGFLTRPIISNYAIDLGATVPLAGFLAGFMATAALCMRPLTGAISDRLDKKKLLTLSCALFCIGALGAGLMQSVLWMGIFLGVQGLAFAIKSALVISFVPLIVPKKYIGTGVGWIGLAYTLGIALGPAIGSFVGQLLGYSMTFIASGLILLAAFVLTLFFKPPAEAAGHKLNGNEDQSAAEPEALNDKSPKEELLKAGSELETAVAEEEEFPQADIEELEKDRAGTAKAQKRRFSLSTIFYLPVIPISIIGGMLMVAQGVTSSFVLLTGEMRGVDTISLYFVFYSIANLGARPLAGRASDAFGVKMVAPPMMLVAIGGMLALAFLPNIFGVALGGLCMGLGQGSAYATIQAESVRGVPSDQLGRSANTFFLGPDLAMGLGPVAGGAVLESFGPAAMYVFNAAVIALSLVMFLMLGIFKKKGTEQTISE